MLCASYTNPPLELIFCSRNDPNTIGGGHANLAVLRNHLLDLGGSVMSEDKVIACRIVGKERERKREKIKDHVLSVEHVPRPVQISMVQIWGINSRKDRGWNR